MKNNNFLYAAAGIVAAYLIYIKMKTSSLLDKAAAFIKPFESFSPNTFWDFKQWSIGYGTVAKTNVEVITEPVASARLSMELVPLNNRLAAYHITPVLNDNEKIALLSFGFNLGVGDLNIMLRRLSEGMSRVDVASKMNLYYNAGGAVSPGLVIRRKAEVNLFLS